MPSISAAAPASTSSSSPYIPIGNDDQQATELQITPQSNTTTDNTITFVIPEMRINYPSSWNALPGIPTSPYVDSIVTFTLLPQNKGNNSNLNDSVAILNIARHSLFNQVVALEEYVGTQLYFLRNTIPGFNLLQPLNKTTLDGRPAYQAVYTGLEGTDETETMKLWVTSGSFRYIVTYSTNPESFPANLESVRNMIGSLKITGAQAPPDVILIGEGLNHIPDNSREKLRTFANGLVLSSVFDSNLVQFMEGSTTTVPANFTKVTTYPADDDGSSISAYYYMSPSYLSPESDRPEPNKEPYKLLVLMFTNDTSNKLITGPSPIDYRVSINGTNFNFEENGTTPTGVDIKILNGTSFVEALKNPQEYNIRLDIQNLNRGPGSPS
ncbi:MAG TPA: hypothetical protein VKA91_04270 [Nitrososphaeraceae archaeon]|nr:hypothetical protein [Nitrososphaeraceae archaeon]